MKDVNYEQICDKYGNHLLDGVVVASNDTIKGHSLDVIISQNGQPRLLVDNERLYTIHSTEVIDMIEIVKFYDDDEIIEEKMHHLWFFRKFKF